MDEQEFGQHGMEIDNKRWDNEANGLELSIQGIGRSRKEHLGIASSDTSDEWTVNEYVGGSTVSSNLPLKSD